MKRKASGGERELLRRVRARSNTGNGIRLGIGDDCAILRPRPEEEILVTTDFSIEGRHFHLATHPPEAIGHKCLARGLSDIASMGGRPIAAFLSLAIPSKLTRNQPSWMDRFYDGLLALARRHRVTLAGGDLSQSPLAVADVVLIGATQKGRALRRSGARAGDILYVSGTLGGAAAELATIRPRTRKLPVNSPDHPHFYPQPRVSTGRALLQRKLATACIDISDGLSVDLLHLCEESTLNAEVDAFALPIHAGATMEDALNGGDDYELLFTAAPGVRVPKRLGGVATQAIGRMVARKPGSRGNRVTLIRYGGRRMPLRADGWQHF